MTDEESEELDQEIMDLLNEEDQEKGMYSNDAEASGDFTSGRFSGDYETMFLRTTSSLIKVQKLWR